MRYFLLSISSMTSCSLRQSTHSIYHIFLKPVFAEREYGEKARMQEYYYFHGHCSVHKKQIGENFLKLIGETNACPVKKYCKIENVNIRCGDEPEDDDFFVEDRRRRSVDVFLDGAVRHRRSRTSRRPQRRRGSRRHQYITFSIVVPLGKGHTSFSGSMSHSKVNLLRVAKRISKLSFIAGGRHIKATRVRVRQPIPICRPGLKIGIFHKDSCGKCHLNTCLPGLPMHFADFVYP